jgi:hypothetical protein
MMEDFSPFSKNPKLTDVEMAEALKHCNVDRCKSSLGNSLKERLVERLEDILRSSIGEPTSQNNTEWRYGNSGSLCIDVGPKRGAWKDFETDEGGGLLKLLARHWELDPDLDQIELEKRAEALLEKLSHAPIPSVKGEKDAGKWTASEAIEAFWHQGGDLSEKHGSAYLRNRGIDPDRVETSVVREVQHKSSKTAREFPAIIFPMLNAVEEVVAIQAVRCPHGNKLDNAAKITNGHLKGAAIKLPGNRTADGEIIIVEGPEDALSVWQLTGIEAWATCSVGNLGFVPVLSGQRIVVIGDADEKTEELTRTACGDLAERCASVRLVFPYGDYKDPNDILMSEPDNAAEILLQLIDQAQEIVGDKISDVERCRLISMEEMMADLGPPSWLIEDHLERDTLAVLFGEPKSGKTFVALDMALSVASGSLFHNKITQQGAVVYVAGEGLSGLKRRTKAWCIEHEIDALSLPVLWSRRGQALTDDNETLALSQDISLLAEKAGEPVRLIVIDTLNRNFGGADENNTKDMTAFVSNLDFLRAEHEATILVIHHSGLGNSDRSRGSSVLYGAVDANMKVVKKQDAVVFTVEVLKDADSPPPMLFANHLIEFEVQGGEIASSLVLRTSDIPAGVITNEEFFLEYPALRSNNRRDKFQQRLPGILDVMYNGQKGWKDISKSYSGQGKGTFDGYIKRLRAAGLVHPDCYELTDVGKSAAQKLVPVIGLSEAFQDDAPSLFGSFVKPDSKPDNK